MPHHRTSEIRNVKPATGIRYSRYALIGAALIASTLVAGPVWAHEDGEVAERKIEEIFIIGRAERLIRLAGSASTGRVGQAELKARPFLRAGEILEVVPGLIITQHSGTGKANQYFLRGFNLDHGNDFSTFVEGVPINLPTHGHGQGYLDLNSVIPELVEVIDYRKGPYYADVGDFSSAGTSTITYVTRLERPFASLGIGEDGFYRGVGGASFDLAGGDLLLAGEGQFYDGPWDREENLAKYNGLTKWTRGDAHSGVSLLATAYYSDWDSADQIPRRAVKQGLIGPLGSIDDELGGRAARYAASLRAWHGHENITRLQAYVARHELDLWSNFTYLLDDADDGDEFQQLDDRIVAGFDLSQDILVDVAGRTFENTFGVQTRYDDINDVGLFQTAGRKRLATKRLDRVRQTSLGLWWRGEIEMTHWLRAMAGLRGDFYWFDVDSRTLTENSGTESDAIVSPKVGLILGPWMETELYLNWGLGFHSNDARGATIHTDPSSGDPVDPVDPLVRSQGYEAGVRTMWFPGLHSTIALWYLDIDSEIVFVGDAGTTEASRPSIRYGVEFANYWRATDWLTLDVDVTLTESEFDDSDPAGDKIPGAVESTVAAGAAVALPSGFFSSIRLRHIGGRELVEDGSIQSDPTTLVNLQAGYEWLDLPLGDLELSVDVLNLLDSDDDDITYFYASRLPGEPEEGVEDEHFHPVEPRTIRAYLTWRY